MYKDTHICFHNFSILLQCESSVIWEHFNTSLVDSNVLKDDVWKSGPFSLRGSYQTSSCGLLLKNFNPEPVTIKSDIKALNRKNEPFVCEMTVMWHMSQLPVVQTAAGLVPPWPGSILLPWGPPWSCTSGLCLDWTCWDYSCFRAPHFSGMQQKPSLKGLSCVLTHSRQLEDLLWLLPSTDLASSCWMAPLIMISLFSLADHSRCSSV